MARMVHCVKLNKGSRRPRLPAPARRTGQKIWQSVSKEAWAGWLKHQTMLINENRLNMADTRARQYLLKQTEKYFFGEGADQASGYVPPPSA